MSIIRFVEGDFYIYATQDGCFEMYYRQGGAHRSWSSPATGTT